MLCSQRNRILPRILSFAEAIAIGERQAPTAEMCLVDTPNAKTIAELVEQFNLPIEKTVKL